MNQAELIKNSVPLGRLWREECASGDWVAVNVCPGCGLRGYVYDHSYARPCKRCGEEWYGSKVGRWVEVKEAEYGPEPSSLSRALGIDRPLVKEAVGYWQMKGEETAVPEEGFDLVNETINTATKQLVAMRNKAITDFLKSKGFKPGEAAVQIFGEEYVVEGHKLVWKHRGMRIVQ